MTEQENKGWTLHDEVERRLISFFDNQDGLRFPEDDEGELQRTNLGSLVVTNEYGSFALDDLIDAVLGRSE